jgi:DUF1365 family protein
VVTVLARKGRAPGRAPSVRLLDRAPYLYEIEIRHVRTTPIRNDFTYRSHQWFVDLDALPRLPRLLRPFARFEARDHCGHPGRSLRRNVDTYLAAQGIDLHGGQVRMLANARSLGHVFNPLTVYWCHDGRTGDLRCVIAEVHNTYGGRHRYLLTPESDGKAEVDKAFYVSPFYAVAGRYRMRLPEPAETVDLHVTLHPPDGAPFTASVRGPRRPACGPGLLRLLLRRPCPTMVVSARIRLQGIRLYLRGLPVVPRRQTDADRRQETV